MERIMHISSSTHSELHTFRVLHTQSFAHAELYAHRQWEIGSLGLELTHFSPKKKESGSF